MSFDDASFLVTGGTGSFGQEFVRTVLEQCRPRRLAVFSRDELKQYHMMHDPRFAERAELAYILGDVRDQESLETAMRGIEIVVHAAALKQVEAAENNPLECIRTNVNGAQNVVQAALRTGVRKVVMMSTDKATNPINLYGASKLAGEKIFVAANNLSGPDGPDFSVVRYGNVANSRGSVVPRFLSLLSQGVNRLPITDKRMTRFFITLREGVDFVLASIESMQGGEIFVPKLPNVRIVDLAEAMAPGMEIEIVGIRPGEKLHEVLISEDESRKALEYPKSFLIEPSFSYWRNGRANGGLSVPDGFRYSSDSHSGRLGVNELRSHLADLDLLPS